MISVSIFFGFLLSLTNKKMKIYEKKIINNYRRNWRTCNTSKNFANFLINKKINCRIIVDKRGFKYINNFKKKIHVINSSNLNGNLFFKLLGILILFGFIQSLFIYYFLNLISSFLLEVMHHFFQCLLYYF